jgi:hypothetical protein
MRKRTQLLLPSLLTLLSFLTLTLILGLFATPAHSADVTLAWDPNSEPDLAGYRVYYKTGYSGAPYDGTGAIEGDSPIDVGNVTEFTVHGLTNGVTYFFVVTARDTEGLESDYSNEVNTGDEITLSITSPQSGFYVNASNYTSYTVSGIAEALAAVEIFAGPISLGSTTALADGSWTIDADFTPCSEGAIRLTAESGGSTSEAVTGTYDKTPPALSISYSDPNSSHVDVGTLTITATSSELLSSTPRVTVDRPNPMSTIGPVNMSGSDTLWTYTLTVERHNGSTVVDGVSLVTISNACDLSGNAVEKSSNFTTDTRDTDGDGERDYTDTDDDNDQLPDTWEEDNGLDPLDSTGENGKDGDLDKDGWTNYEEYMAGTDPADNTSHPATSPPEIVETIPYHNAGLNGDTTRIPNDSSFCAWIEDSDGIDITDSRSITFTISDGVHEAYTRDLSEEMVVRVVKLVDDEDTRVTKLWAVYDRSNDDEYGNDYPFDSIITIQVDARDRSGGPVDPIPAYTFKIESQAEHDYAQDVTNLPETSAVPPDDPNLEDPQYVYDAGIQVNSGDLEGAKVIYNSKEPVPPRFGPTDEIPSLDGGRGAPMNLQPPTVFSTPIKILIPYPRREKVDNLHIYLYKARHWVRACDNKGEVQPGGEAWMVPGSRVDHDDQDPSTIEIKVYHLSAIQAEPDTAVSISDNAAEVAGGCFIAATAFQSNMSRPLSASPDAVRMSPCGHPLVLLFGLISLLLTLVCCMRPPSRPLRKCAP